MAKIDVRGVEKDAVDTIVFADESATHLMVMNPDWAEDVYVRLYDAAGDHVVIDNKEHALNLIKALNKAIELGWLV